MKTNQWAATLLWLSTATWTTPAAPVSGVLAPRTDINPAVLYWQGFSLYPDLADPLKKDLLADPPRLPQADAAEVLGKFDATFGFLRRAAQMKERCDWGIDLSDGPATLIPNLIKIRQCTQAARARAHYALEDGRDHDAASDLAAVLVLGRHAGTDGALVSTMVGIAVEEQVTTFIARNFHRFGTSALRSLRKQIDAAPPRPTVQDAMLTEQAAFWEWYIAKLESIQAVHPNDDPKAIEAARQLLASTFDTGAVLDRIIEAAGHTLPGLIAYFKQLGPLYESIQKLADAAPAKLEQESSAVQRLRDTHANEIARVIFPNVGRARKTELAAIVHAAMLRAAIALRLEGETGFQQVRDPFGDGPFTLRRLPAGSKAGGFELDSRLGEISTNTALKFLESQPAAQPAAFE